MRCGAGVTAVIASLILVGVIAGYAGASAASEGSDTDRCLKVSSGLVATLKDGLKRVARGKLGPPRGVKSRGQFSGPNSFANGVWFVSARVRGFGIATWAVDRDAFRTGGGFGTDVGPVARRVSALGISIPLNTLKSWGLTTGAEGYAASRSCAARA